MGIFMGIPQFSKIQITPEILSLIAEIDEFKGEWQVLGHLQPEKLQRLKWVATIASTGSSTRIEGAHLTNAEIGKLLGGLDVQSFRSRDEQEVAGYAKVLETIFNAFGTIPLDEAHLQQLHGILLQHSDKDERHRGYYKKFPNCVEAYSPDGKSLGVVFQTASPFETPKLIRELLAWVAPALANGELHPLLVIAIFIVHFLAIHPFQDGNGRLSRALTTMLLLKSGYSYVPYSSMEQVIEENKSQYYLALRSAQGTLYTDNSKLNDWVVFFLRSMKAQKDNLAKKIDVEKATLKLPLLAQEIMALVREHGQVNNAMIQVVTKANRNTIKATLERLVEQGHLEQHGERKGTRYTLK
jgi:Fic family protein